MTECPRHRPGHTRSAHCQEWPDGRWTFRCHVCDIGPLDVIDLLVELGEVVDRGAAIRQLGATEDVVDFHTVQRSEPRPDPPPTEPMTSEPNERMDGVEAERILADYLTTRQWRPETSRALDLHVVRRNGEARIRHPFTAGGRWYAAQDRAVGSSAPKWMTTKGSKLIPYNLDAIVRTKEHLSCLVLCEGPADTITLLDTFGTDYPALGIPGAGNWKSQWTRAIKSAGWPSVAVASDNDEAGDRLRATIAEELDGIAGVRCLEIPDGCSDLNDWRIASGESFSLEFLRALDSEKRPVASSGELDFGDALPVPKITDEQRALFAKARRQMGLDDEVGAA